MSKDLNDLATRLHSLPPADQLIVAAECLRSGSASRRKLARIIIDRVNGLLSLEELRGAR